MIRLINYTALACSSVIFLQLVKLAWALATTSHSARGSEHVSMPTVSWPTGWNHRRQRSFKQACDDRTLAQVSLTKKRLLMFRPVSSIFPSPKGGHTEQPISYVLVDSKRWCFTTRQKTMGLHIQCIVGLPYYQPKLICMSFLEDTNQSQGKLFVNVLLSINLLIERSAIFCSIAVHSLFSTVWKCSLKLCHT